MTACRRWRPVVAALVVLTVVGACADDDETGATPSTEDRGFVSTVDPSSPVTSSASDGEAGADQCVVPDAMDAGALGVAPAAPPAAAEAFVRTILGWDDAAVVPGDRPCRYRATSPSHERPVSLLVATTGSSSAVVHGASSFEDEADGTGVGVMARGAEMSITTAASCPSCERATVHVVYAGGVETVETALPVEATVTLPAGATRRGFVVLLRSASGAVEAVVAISIAEGDFAAG